MPHSATHIIARQSYRFRLPEAVDTAEVQRLCNEELPARLNELFDNLCGPETVLRLKSLDIRLNLDPADFSMKSLGKKLSEAVGIALQEQLQNAATRAGSKAELAIDGLLFYLEKGFLPWWFKTEQTASVLAPTSALSDTDFNRFLSRLQQILRRSAAASQRLSESLATDVMTPDHFQRWSGFPMEMADGILSFLEAVHRAKTGVHTDAEFHRKLGIALVSNIKHRSTSHQENIRSFFATADAEGLLHFESHASDIFGVMLEKSVKNDRERMAIRAAVEGLRENAANISDERSGDRPSEEAASDLDKAADENRTLDSSLEQVSDNRIRIGNAGLVLIAPYLGRLFESCGVAENSTLTAPAKAIALLRHCVFGNVDCSEHELVFEKILCGMEPAESPEFLPQLSSEEKRECDVMLNAVVANWPVLKQTSPEGLQQSFLQRDGLLQENDAGWQLRVQRQPHDILLDFIPWSFSIVRSPWMKGMIFVDWSK